MPAPKKYLRLTSNANALAIPAEAAATQTFGVLGMRGAGKSNTAVVMAEEMHAANIPWVAVDPKGDWHGLRSSADGKKPGLPILVLGGLHGDVPLESTAGSLVADVIVDENLTCVLDVSDFSKGERAKFLVDFFDRLYRRHRKEPQARHIFLEEAHEYIPQQVMASDARLKEAAARIPLQGRTFGLGSSVLSQRSARLHKDVLTQIGTLIVLRTTAPNDKRAIEAWVEDHGLGRELVKSLPELNDGEAWIWSPQFLKVMKRISFRRRNTYDSGATPVMGSKRTPAILADVDLDALKAKMAATIERVKENDPKELKRRIAQLEHDLKSAEYAAKLMSEARKEERVKEEKVEVPVLRAEDIEPLCKELRESRDQLSAIIGEDLSGWRDMLGEMNDKIEAAIKRATPPVHVSAPSSSPILPAKSKLEYKSPPKFEFEITSVGARVDPVIFGNITLNKAERSILSVLAQYPDGRSHKQIAILAGYASGGGGFNNALSRLRSTNLIVGGRNDLIRLTEQGKKIAPHEPLPTGRELLEMWLSSSGKTGLSKAHKAILTTLWEAQGRVMSKEEVAAKTGYEVGGGGFNNAIGKLRTLELIEGPGSALRVSETLL